MEEGYCPCKNDMIPVIKKTAEERDSKENKYERLMDFFRNAKQEKFTGYVKINFSQGQIGRIEKFEEILKG
ncbi:MAG: hypothetical protein C4522_05015 [Desulfobacteraceae bacterium]|nr:MAG: hypothetical protein C4522_05015 [Desulfobacteraceae bacterium]